MNFKIGKATIFKMSGNLQATFSKVRALVKIQIKGLAKEVLIKEHKEGSVKEALIKEE